MQNKIQEFNMKLVQDNKDITIIDYVKDLNKEYFNIDIDFIDDFIDMVNKDDFIIPHNMLQKYQVITIRDTYEVKRILEQYEFEEDIDYKKSTPASGRGATEYMLKGEIFKTILMRSKNTRKYADYYLLLEKAIFYYSQYEKLKLEEKINKISKIKLLELSNNKTLDNFVVVKCDPDTLIVTRYKNRKVVSSHDCITYPYALIKGKNRNIHSVMNECNLKVSNILIELEVPSHQNFTIRIKEILKNNFSRLIRQYKYIMVRGTEERKYIEDIEDEDEDDEIKTSVTRFFKLVDISEEDFIKNVYEIDKMRFES